MFTLLTIAFLVILAVVLLAIGIAWRWIESRRQAQANKMLATAAGKRLEPRVTVLRPKVDAGTLADVFSHTTLSSWISRRLEQAGVGWTPVGFVALGIASGAAGLFFGLLFPFLLTRWISAPVLGCLFAFVPLLWLTVKRRNRLAAFEEQFPEALDFLSRSIRAGHALSVSLEMLAEESIEPASQEFRRIFNEQNLGAPLETALQNLVERVPLVDVKFFVSALTLQRETGGNLSEILLKLAHVIRERFQVKGQVRAASAHGRVTGAVLTAMPILLAVALLIVAPNYLQTMAKDPDGKYLIAGAVAAQLIGYYLIHRIIRIKV